MDAIRIKLSFPYNPVSISNKKDDADLWLLNSCTVKNPAEEHFKNEVNKGLDTEKKVVVAGCVPQGKIGRSFASFSKSDINSTKIYTCDINRTFLMLIIEMLCCEGSILSCLLHEY